MFHGFPHCLRSYKVRWRNVSLLAFNPFGSYMPSTNTPFLDGGLQYNLNHPVSNAPQGMSGFSVPLSTSAARANAAQQMALYRLQSNQFNQMPPISSGGVYTIGQGIGQGIGNIVNAVMYGKRQQAQNKLFGDLQ